MLAKTATKGGPEWDEQTQLPSPDQKRSHCWSQLKDSDVVRMRLVLGSGLQMDGVRRIRSQVKLLTDIRVRYPESVDGHAGAPAEYWVN